AARLKHAWASTITQESQQVTAGLDPLNEDELLPATQLTDIRAAFHKRYKMSFVPEQLPSDCLLSKLRRAIQRRNIEVLEVIDLWSVRAIYNQRMGMAKKRKIAWVEQAGDKEIDVRVERSCQSWLDLLHTYCLGLAMAGEQETSTSSSLRYVQVPWDVTFKYHWRARAVASKMGDGCLARLILLDQQERSEWESSTSSLGEVIAEVYQLRDVHWQSAMSNGSPNSMPWYRRN
ncbi:unnamed protein product, partial [Effrenium voratum]